MVPSTFGVVTRFTEICEYCLNVFSLHTIKYYVVSLDVVVYVAILVHVDKRER